MAGVVAVPVAVQDAVLGRHPGMQGGVGVWREDVEGGRFYALADGPLDGPVEYVRAVVVHSEDEAGVDHDAQVVESADCRVVIAADVLVLALPAEVGGVDGLE